MWLHMDLFTYNPQSPHPFHPPPDPFKLVHCVAHIYLSVRGRLALDCKAFLLHLYPCRVNGLALLACFVIKRRKIKLHGFCLPPLRCEAALECWSYADSCLQIQENLPVCKQRVSNLVRRYLGSILQFESVHFLFSTDNYTTLIWAMFLAAKTTCTTIYKKIFVYSPVGIRKVKPFSSLILWHASTVSAKNISPCFPDKTQLSYSSKFFSVGGISQNTCTVDHTFT